MVFDKPYFVLYHIPNKHSKQVHKTTQVQFTASSTQQGCPLEGTFRHLHNYKRAVKIDDIDVQISLLETKVSSINGLNLDTVVVTH